MSNTSSITNKLTNKSCLTSGGKCITTDTIYAAECTKHNLIYVGHSSQKLSGRFNGHRYDVKVGPNACESRSCKIEKDLKVYILQNNATGTREKREFVEECWITRLNTKSLNGMNSYLKDFVRHFTLYFNISYHFIHSLFPLFYLYHMLNTTLLPISLFFSLSSSIVYI